MTRTRPTRPLLLTFRVLAFALSIFFVALAGLIFSLTWGGSGSVADLLAGQREPGIHLPEQARTGNAAYTVPKAAGARAHIRVDASLPVFTLPNEYLSFGLDVAQVLGGTWWDPAAKRPEGGEGSVREPPFNFNRPKLDSLVRPLAPAYLRIGGSAADLVHYDFPETAGPPENGVNGGPKDAASPSARKVEAGPGKDFRLVLTPSIWDAANAFALRNGLNIDFTLNAGPGPRKDGVWDPREASSLIEYSAARNYPVSVWELGNEMNGYRFVLGWSSWVNPGQYASDLARLIRLARGVDPKSRVSSQGSAFWPVLGEPFSVFFKFEEPSLEAAHKLTRAGTLAEPDIVNWHFYPQQSRRAPISSRRAAPARLLEPANLDEFAYWADYMRGLRDRYAPGKSIWLGETGNAQFGGEPGVSDAFIGGLWWVDELGLAARLGVSTVVRQTLVGMNYGMLDAQSLDPLPDYWNSLLWKRIMGNRVFKVKVDGPATLRAYAQSYAADPRRTAVLLINLDPERPVSIRPTDISGAEAITSNAGIARRIDYTAADPTLYRLEAPDIFGKTLFLNGNKLAIESDSDTGTVRIPDLLSMGMEIKKGDEITLAPLSYAFVVY